MNKATHVLLHKRDKKITHLVTIENGYMTGYLSLISNIWYNERDPRRLISKLTLYTVIEMSKLLRLIYE